MNLTKKRKYIKNYGYAWQSHQKSRISWYKYLGWKPFSLCFSSQLIQAMDLWKGKAVKRWIQMIDNWNNFLVGSFNPSEKYKPKWKSSPTRANIKIFELPPPSFISELLNNPLPMISKKTYPTSTPFFERQQRSCTSYTHLKFNQFTKLERNTGWTILSFLHPRKLTLKHQNRWFGKGDSFVKHGHFRCLSETFREPNKHRVSKKHSRPSDSSLRLELPIAAVFDGFWSRKKLESHPNFCGIYTKPFLL